MQRELQRPAYRQFGGMINPTFVGNSQSLAKAVPHLLSGRTRYSYCLRLKPIAVVLVPHRFTPKLKQLLPIRYSNLLSGASIAETGTSFGNGSLPNRFRSRDDTPRQLMLPRLPRRMDSDYTFLSVPTEFFA